MGAVGEAELGVSCESKVSAFGLNGTGVKLKPNLGAERRDGVWACCLLVSLAGLGGVSAGAGGGARWHHVRHAGTHGGWAGSRMGSRGTAECIGGDRACNLLKLKGVRRPDVTHFSKK